MAESRLIQKQLAGKEDLLLGIGTVSQARATGVKTITKLNATHFGGVLVVDTINDLNSLDKNQLDEQVVFVKEDGLTYIYNGISWVTKTIIETVDTLADLRSISYPAVTVWVSGYHTKNDGAFGSHIFRLKGIKTTETDIGGTVIIATVGGTDYVYELQYDGAVNAKWFGAKGDGITNDTVNISKLFVFDTIVFTKGTYLLGSLTFPNINIILEKGAILKPTPGSIIAFGVLGETKVATINSGDYEIFDTTDGDISFISVNKINPLWFSHNYVGFSQRISGYLAGHNAIGNKDNFNYTHIDGYRACEKTTNTVEDLYIGVFAGSGVLTSSLSTAVGYGALRGEESPPGSGVFNNRAVASATAIGQGAFQNGVDTSYSTAVGAGAGLSIPNANGVDVFGANAARLAGSLSNVAIFGTVSGYNFGTVGTVEDSRWTTLIGSNVAYNAKQGERATLIGANSGLYSKDISNNTWIGYFTGPDSAVHENVTESICIGSLARTRGKNTITIGNRVTNIDEGRTIIGGASSTSVQIMGIYGLTTASSANMFVESNHMIYRSTSSIKYKTDIEDLEYDWAKKILDLRPVFYKSTASMDNRSYGWYGFIAEEVAQIDPRFAIWAKEPLVDEDGNPIVDEETGQQLLGEEKPNGVAYDRMVVHLQKIVKTQEERLIYLENKIKEIVNTLNV